MENLLTPGKTICWLLKVCFANRLFVEILLGDEILFENSISREMFMPFKLWEFRITHRYSSVSSCDLFIKGLLHSCMVNNQTMTKSMSQIQLQNKIKSINGFPKLHQPITTFDLFHNRPFAIGARWSRGYTIKSAGMKTLRC